MCSPNFTIKPSLYIQACEIPGLKIFRFESSLYYANSEHFIEKLFLKSGVNPRKLRARMIKAERKLERYKTQEQNGLKQRKPKVSTKLVASNTQRPTTCSPIREFLWLSISTTVPILFYTLYFMVYVNNIFNNIKSDYWKYIVIKTYFNIPVIKLHK
jgi:hypothetical protein